MGAHQFSCTQSIHDPDSAGAAGFALTGGLGATGTVVGVVVVVVAVGGGGETAEAGASGVCATGGGAGGAVVAAAAGGSSVPFGAAVSAEGVACA